MKIAVLYSGGKDSNYAAYMSKINGDEISCLLTGLPDSEESFMFHFPNISLTHLQSEAMNLPQLSFRTKGIPEKELNDLKAALVKAKDLYNIEGIYTGGLSSRYQKQRFGNICSDLDLKCVNPLWGIDSNTYFNKILSLNFKVMVVGVAAEGLDEHWLGQIFDYESTEKLKILADKFKFDPLFEGGEGETLVVDSPLFLKKLEILDSSICRIGGYSYLKINNAVLFDKSLIKNEVIS